MLKGSGEALFVAEFGRLVRHEQADDQAEQAEDGAEDLDHQYLDESTGPSTLAFIGARRQ